MATPDRSPVEELRLVQANSRVPAARAKPRATLRDDVHTARWYVRCEVIERARLLAGKTRLQVAADANVDYKTLRDMLNRRRQPTIATAHCVIRALSLDPAEVIAFDH